MQKTGIGAWGCRLAAAGLLAGGAWSPAAAGDRLSELGVFLGTLQASAEEVPLGRAIELGFDQPAATHVIAQFQNNQPLQRTNTGYWVPWNGDPATLIDNHFPVEDRRVHFKLVAEDLSQGFLPVVFTLIYRVGGTLKSGKLTVHGE